MELKRILSAFLVVVMVIAIFTAYPAGFASAASKLQSDVYYIDRDGGYIYDVVAGTTVSEIIKNFKNTDKITVTDKDGVEQSDDLCVSTGNKVVYGTDVFDIIVKGDLNGDGLISALDIVAYTSYLKSLMALEGCYLLAGDIDYDDAINSNDYALFKQHLKSNFSIYSLKHPETGKTVTYTVKFESGENGTIDGTTSFIVEDGISFSEIAVPATVPSKGYVFYGWTPEFPETVEQDLTFTAVFTKDGESWHTLSFVAGENGTLTGNAVIPDIFTGTESEDLTLPTPVANPGYKFKEWSPAIPEEITEDMKFTAVFEYDPTQYATVSFHAGNHGTLDGKGSYTVLKGTAWSEIEVPTPVPDQYYIFNSWSSPFPSVINEDMSFTASFSADPNSSVKNYASSANGGQYSITSGTIREDFPDSFASGTEYGSGYLNDTITLTDTDQNWVEVSRKLDRIVIMVKLAQPITMTRASVNVGLRFDSTNRVLPEEMYVYVGSTLEEANTYFGGAYSESYASKGEYGYNVTIDGNAEQVQYVQFVFMMSETNSFIARFGEVEVYGTVGKLVPTYNVKFQAGENGSISGVNSYTVDEGTLWSVITVPTPVPAPGYKFTGWTPAIPDSSEPVTADAVYTANFEYDSTQWATLTFAAGNGGSLSGSNTVTVLKGELWSNISVPTPVAADGYEFIGWTPAFPTTVSADTTFTANFELLPEMYDITFVAGVGGSLSGTTTISVKEGTAWSEITVPSYVANAGYKFDSWSPAFPETITKSATYTANFVVDDSQYATVTFVAGANGIIYGTSTFTVLKGTAWSKITVPSYTADAGYKFDSWTPSFPATITADATYTATFVVDESQYATINFVAGANGTISGTTSYKVLKGTAWTFITVPTCTANTGYKFDSWSPAFPVTINENATYTANFAIDESQYAVITFKAGANGSLSGTTSYTVLKGTAWSEITVPTYTANAGYKFSAWSPSFPTTINSSATYTANFVYDESQWSTINFVAGENGTLGGATSFTVLNGTAWSQITVPTVTADLGYKFSAWSPSFPSTVTQDATYTASFVYDATQHATVTFVASEGGKLSGTTSFTVLKGSDWSAITVPTATANDGYTFDGWDVAFPSNINADATYTAKFSLIPTYAVVFTAGDGGSLSGNWYFEGIYAGTVWQNVVTVPTPVPNDGYVFDSWSPELPAANSTIEGNVTYTAIFTPELPAITRPNYASSANGGSYGYLAGTILEASGDTTFSTQTSETYRSGWSNITTDFGYGMLNDDALVTATDGSWVEISRGSYSSGYSTTNNVIVFLVKLSAAKSDIEQIVINLGTMSGATTNRGLPNSVKFEYSTKSSMSSNMSWRSYGTVTEFESISAYGHTATIDTSSVSSSVKYIRITLTMTSFYVGRVGEIQVLGPETNTTPRKISFSASEGGTLSGTTSFTVADGTSWSQIAVPTPVPNAGYKFSYWSPTLPASTSSITKDASYEAVFTVDNGGEEKNYALSANGGTYMVTAGTVQTGFPDSFASGEAYGSGRLNDGSLLTATNDPWVEISRSTDIITITVKLNTAITMSKAVINLGLRNGSSNRVLPDSVSVYAGSTLGTLTLFGSSTSFVADGDYGYNVTINGNAEEVTYVRFDCPMSNYIARFGEVEVYGSTGPVIPTYNVTFNAGNNGSLTGTTVQTVQEGATWADIVLPTPVADPGYKFDSWTPSIPSSSTAITADTSFTANFVYDATQWATVTFVAGANGTLSGTTSYTVLNGTEWSTISVPSPNGNEGYSFTGWTPSFPSTITTSATYTANFELTPVAKYTITFVAGTGGTLSGTTSVTVEEGTLWSAVTVPTPVANSGYSFVTWSPAFPTADTAITTNLTFYARFEESGSQALKGVININGINASQYISGGSHIYTEAYGQYFTAAYWHVFVAKYSEAKGGYIITEILAVGATKSVEVPTGGIIIAVHMGAENQPICSNIAVGDLLVPNSAIDLNNLTITTGYSYVSVYEGDGTLPDDPEQGGDDPVTPLAGEFTPINYDKVKAMWLSQFDLSGVYMSSSTQRAESSFRSLMSTILDNCVNLGLNTVIVQVRPNGDSMYPSEYYTMSKYVVGAYGRDANYDPFEIIIELAHARNLSVQAWINPMRLMSSTDIAKVNTKYKIAEWYQSSTYNGTYVVLYNSYYYLNPAYEEVRQLIIDGAKEIATLYDIDGLHMDDYFYPTTATTFDSAAYNSYTGSLSLANWRRQNLNLLVKGLYDAVKEANPDMLFGISPAGNMSTVYNSQYADVYTWCSTAGYIDYICPQVYFGMKHSSQGFASCSTGWSNIVTHANVTLYVGITLGKALDGYNGTIDTYAGTTEGQYEWVNNRDVVKQCLEYTRDSLSKCTGVAFFCYQYFYDPVSGSSIVGTAEERANFLPVLQAMW